MGGENTTTPRPSSEGKEAPGPAATRPWHRPRGRPPPRLPAGEAFPRPGPSEGHRRQREAPSRERRRLRCPRSVCHKPNTPGSSPPMTNSFFSTVGAAIPRLPDDAPSSFLPPPPRPRPTAAPPARAGQFHSPFTRTDRTSRHPSPDRHPPPPSPTERLYLGRDGERRPALPHLVSPRCGEVEVGGAAV